MRAPQAVARSATAVTPFVVACCSTRPTRDKQRRVTGARARSTYSFAYAHERTSEPRRVLCWPLVSTLAYSCGVPEYGVLRFLRVPHCGMRVEALAVASNTSAAIRRILEAFFLAATLTLTLTLAHGHRHRRLYRMACEKCECSHTGRQAFEACALCNRCAPRANSSHEALRSYSSG